MKKKRNTVEKYTGWFDDSKVVLRVPVIIVLICSFSVLVSVNNLACRFNARQKINEALCLKP